MFFISGLDRFSWVIISMLAGLSMFSWAMIIWSIWTSVSFRFGSCLVKEAEKLKVEAKAWFLKFGKFYQIELVGIFAQEAVESRFKATYQVCYMLSLFASVSTLLGLLGTVWGLINSMSGFGAVDSKLLAGGVYQALYTTFFGLVVAIPAALFARAIPIFIQASEKKVVSLAREVAVNVLSQKNGELVGVKKGEKSVQL